MRKTNKDRIFFETLIKMNAYIDEHFDEEGVLPPETKMSELFGVSRGTYRTVLASLIENNFVTNYPKRRGHFVLPKRFRINKAGIVVGAGKECPFLASMGALTGMIDRLREHRIECQLIQSSLPENLKIRALAHAAKVLVWVMPPSELIPTIIAGVEETPFAQLVMSFAGVEFSPAITEKLASVTPNTVDSIKNVAKFFIDRGYCKVAYLGGGETTLSVLKETFGEAGISYDESWLIPYQDNWLERVVNLLKKGDIAALFVGGSNPIKEKVYYEIDKLSANKQPRIFVSDGTYYQFFKNKFPKLRFMGYSSSDLRELGVVAADEIAANILHGKIMSSKQVETHHIIED